MNEAFLYYLNDVPVGELTWKARIARRLDYPSKPQQREEKLGYELKWQHFVLILLVQEEASSGEIYTR